ncbi:MAG: carboxylating nicotinate-nucleotide diphosphorylase [Polyangiaceae bacterium]|nr:carboxylating nicotinate-nucleotide diphosphorylase [Polyangiaceae bacterium]
MLPDFLITDLVDRALAEDLSGGDLTTEALVHAEARGIARITAKSRLVVCGSRILARAFYRVDPGLRVEEYVEDGAGVEPGELLWVAEGRTRGLLMAERTALNFVQHLSGIATLTRSYVEALPQGSKTRIVDTRKTTPGLRQIERYAVRTGGGHNHRDALGSAVLIKENHIAAAGGVSQAIERARQHAPHTSRIEIEVEELEQIEEALSARADILMLDNFADADVEAAVRRINGRALVEVSGGITLERIPRLAALGVDVISVGALTHSVKAADISLRLESLSQ